MNLSVGDILIIVSVVLAIVIGVLVYFGRRNYARNLEAQSFINQHKMVTPILVIDKKFERPTPENLPKNIYEKLPKASKIQKIAIVKAKVGPQITTLMCDKNIYQALPTKKTIKVELAGIYISSIIGMDLENKKNKTFREKTSLWAQKNMKK